MVEPWMIKYSQTRAKPSDDTPPGRFGYKLIEVLSSIVSTTKVIIFQIYRPILCFAGRHFSMSQHPSVSSSRNVGESGH